MRFFVVFFADDLIFEICGFVALRLLALIGFVICREKWEQVSLSLVLNSGTQVKNIDIDIPLHLISIDDRPTLLMILHCMYVNCRSTQMFNLTDIISHNLQFSIISE